MDVLRTGPRPSRCIVARHRRRAPSARRSLTGTSTKKRGSSSRSSDPDPDGRYLIEYCVKVPYLMTATSYSRVPTQRQRVTGKRARDFTVAALRKSDYKIIRVSRTNWFG